MNDRDHEKLERLIEGAVSGLPLRQAPAALERRVLEEVARRAALPWWRRGFAQWPMAARAGFLIVCVLLAGLSLTSSVTQQVDIQSLIWIRSLVGLITTMGGTATLVASLVPPLWIYVCLGVGALLYLLLFGLGACAYRTLYLQHSNNTMIRS
jgi:hypothetical protein